MSGWPNLLTSAHKVVLIAVIICGGAPLSAQQTIKILTPASDSCAAFVKALNANEQPLLLALAGWATGYLSGVAQGTGIDFLRRVEPGNTSVIVRLERECRQQPQQLMSVVLEKISRDMIRER
jgi:hypothetical protein